MTSFDNVHTTGKVILITIDASPRMNTNQCLTTKNLVCLEAAAVMSLSFLKTEKKVTVATFNKKTITLQTIEKGKVICYIDVSFL